VKPKYSWWQQAAFKRVGGKQFLPCRQGASNLMPWSARIVVPTASARFDRQFGTFQRWCGLSHRSPGGNNASRALADHNHGRPAVAVFLPRELATDFGGDAESMKEPGRNALLRGQFRARAHGRGLVPMHSRRDWLERIHHSENIASRPGRDGRSQDSKRLDHGGVDDGKDGRVCADCRQLPGLRSVEPSFVPPGS
jgi:hypothetical protein